MTQIELLNKISELEKRNNDLLDLLSDIKEVIDKVNGNIPIEEKSIIYISLEYALKDRPKVSYL